MKGILIDFSQLFFRHFFANKRSIEENPEFLAHLLFSSVYKIIKDFGVKEKGHDLVLAFDCPRSFSWRTEYFKKHSANFHEYHEMSYKGHRKKDEEVDWETIYNVLGDIEEIFKEATDVKVIRHPKAEGDDVIFMGTKYYDTSVIVSSDKDFKQLISSNVAQYDPITNKWVSLKESGKEYFTSAEEFLKYHIMAGDASDGILPVRKGWGIVNIMKRLPELEKVLEENELVDLYKFNEDLIDLRNIPKDIQKEIKESFEVSQNNYNSEKILKFFQKYRLRNALGDMGLLSLKQTNIVNDFF